MAKHAYHVFNWADVADGTIKNMQDRSLRKQHERRFECRLCRRNPQGEVGRSTLGPSVPWTQGNPVQFPNSHSIPTSIPSEFPRIDVSGRALGQDEIDAAI